MWKVVNLHLGSIYIYIPDTESEPQQLVKDQPALTQINWVGSPRKMILCEGDVRKLSLSSYSLNLKANISELNMAIPYRVNMNLYSLE